MLSFGVRGPSLGSMKKSEFVPLVDNSTAENRSTNRRTKIYVLPKIDQFYDMIESEMKDLETQGGGQ